jgi:hypothetical protein
VKESLMAFVVKADLFSFHEKTMYRGKDIRIDDEIFVFASSRPSTMGRESG